MAEELGMSSGSCNINGGPGRQRWTVSNEAGNDGEEADR